MRSIALAPNRRENKIIHKHIRVRLLLLELRPCSLKHVINSDNLFRPALCARGFLALGQEILQRGRRVLDIDGTVPGGVEIPQHAHDGLPDRGERGCAEGTAATVVELDAFPLDVHEEADHETPVEGGARADHGVRHARGGRGLLERVLHRDFGLEGGERADLGEGGVGAEFGGEKALDAGLGGGGDEQELLLDGCGAESGYQGVVTEERGGQGVEGGVVHGRDGDGGGELVGAAAAGEDGDLEAGRKEGIHNGGAEVAGSLWR